MNVGALRIRLRLPGNLSLKGKRKVLKSIMGRVGSKFNVAIAEVDNHDLWQLATLGVACVSNDGHHANELLSKVADFVRDMREDAEILDCEIEISQAF